MGIGGVGVGMLTGVADRLDIGVPSMFCHGF